MTSNNENAIIQAIMELSGQLKEMKVEMTGEMQAIRQDLNRVEERLSQVLKELDEKVDLVDAKLDVLSKALITTQADVLRLKQAK